jgi:hypothetical protein
MPEPAYFDYNTYRAEESSLCDAMLPQHAATWCCLRCCLSRYSYGDVFPWGMRGLRTRRRHEASAVAHARGAHDALGYDEDASET